MLTKFELLKCIMERTRVTVHDIKFEFGVAEDAIFRTVKEINELFERDIILSNDQEFYMSERSKVHAYQKFFCNKEKLFKFYNVNHRHNLILIELLVTQDFLSLQKLADICLVSKNTILNDLKILKDSLAEKGLEIKYDRKIGYSIIGSEFTIRNTLVTTIKNVLKLPMGRILLKENNFIEKEQIFLLQKRLEKLEERIGITLTDEQLDELPYILQFVIKRAYKHNNEWSFRIETYDITNTEEYIQIQQVFWDYSELNKNDLLYLSLQILSSNMVESALQISDSDEISIATDHFIENIVSYLAMSVAKKSELKEKLMLHMRPAIYRNLLGFQINNPLTENFIAEYEDIYNVVSKSVTPYEKIIRVKLSKEEIVYLSMIVLSWIYQNEESDSIFKAVVLCRNGTAISKLLLTTLQSMFPKIDFLGAFSIRQFRDMTASVDFIFTTVPIKSDVTTFLIPPVLDKQNRSDLRVKVNRKVKNSSKQISRKLVSTIADYIPVEHKSMVSHQVEKFFEHDYANMMSSPDVKEHFDFSIDNISLVHDVIEWEDIVSYAMQPLLKRGSITENYVNETTRVFYKRYDQMIIAPNVYLPHVGPEQGANKMDFQIVILKQPVTTPLGNKAKVIVGLSPSSENDHVPTLIKLNNLFLNPEILSDITNCNNIFDVKKILT